MGLARNAFLDLFPKPRRRPEAHATLVRLSLIDTVKEEIGRINKADEEWEREFQTAGPRFQEAAAGYLKLKESSAVV